MIISAPAESQANPPGVGYRPLKPWHMIALCVESSHARGMGHFFRSCVLADALVAAGHAVKFYVNDHPPTATLLRQRGIPFDIAPLDDAGQDWERAAIARDGIGIWIYDCHRTDIRS